MLIFVTKSQYVKIDIISTNGFCQRDFTERIVHINLPILQLVIVLSFLNSFLYHTELRVKITVRQQHREIPL